MRTRGHTYGDAAMTDGAAAAAAADAAAAAAAAAAAEAAEAAEHQAAGHKHARSDEDADEDEEEAYGSEFWGDDESEDSDEEGGPAPRRGAAASQSYAQYTPQQRALGVLCWHDAGKSPKRTLQLLASKWPAAEWGPPPSKPAFVSTVKRWSAHLREQGHLFNAPQPRRRCVAVDLEGHNEFAVIMGAGPPWLPPALAAARGGGPQSPARMRRAAADLEDQRHAVSVMARAQSEAQAALEREHAALQAATREVAQRLEAQRAAAAGLEAQALALQMQRAALDEERRRLEERERELGGPPPAQDGLAPDGAAGGQLAAPPADKAAAPAAPAAAATDAAAAGALPPPPAGECMEGPSDAYWFVEVTPGPLEVGRYCDLVADPGAGAVASFVGVTRDTFQGKRVLRLEYEAYVPMALAKLKDLCLQLRRRWDVRRVAVAHRVGVVEVCEASVAIVASSPHRKDALEAVHWAIDELKASVPIWKKEFFADGSQWKENAEARRLMAAVERAEGRAAAGAAGAAAGVA